MKYTLRKAVKTDAPFIAPLIMEAMNHECCQYFAGPHHTLEDFRKMMVELIEQEESQYSYHNSIVAVNDLNQHVVGVIVGYNGSDLHRLRKAFIDAAKKHFDMDHSGMADEAAGDEFYIDSIAVAAEARHQGIASALLHSVIGQQAGKRPVGLLVDVDNPKAELLYLRLGFKEAGTNQWGSHAMKHLQYTAE